MMIDTDKYEGHTIEGSNYNHRLRNDADIQLIADAPLLLAEVKRYRKTLERIAREDYNQNHYEHTEERHIWNMMHNMIQQARMALGQDIETGELRAEEFGAESCTCNDMFGSLCPQCNYDSDREGGVCPKGCTVDLAGSVRPQEMEIYTECKIHGQKLGAEEFGAEVMMDYRCPYCNEDVGHHFEENIQELRWLEKSEIPESTVCIHCRKQVKLGEAEGFFGNSLYYDYGAEEFGAEYEVLHLRGAPHGLLATFIHKGCPKTRVYDDAFEDGELLFFIPHSPIGECNNCDAKITLSNDDWDWVQTWYDDDEFGAEFSRGEMLNLRKYVNYPMRWVNKNLRPSSDSKERKTEQKMKGQIPRRKSPDSFRNTIETPTWFKGIQLGILATIFGAMYVSETNKKRKK